MSVPLRIFYAGYGPDLRQNLAFVVLNKGCHKTVNIKHSVIDEAVDE